MPDSQNTTERSIWEGLLVTPGHLDKDTFIRVAERAALNGSSIPDAIVDEQLMRDDQLGKLWAEYIGFPFVRLANERFDAAVAAVLPEAFARAYGVLVFRSAPALCHVACRDPRNQAVLGTVEKHLGVRVAAYYATETDLKDAYRIYRSAINDEVRSLVAQWERTEEGSARESLNVRIVELILTAAAYAHTSDLHLEPRHSGAVIRLRIDGVLHEAFTLPRALAAVLVARIKVLSAMAYDEHRRAQDGRFRFLPADDEPVDVRVSIVPTASGEQMVLRLLSAAQGSRQLAELGLSAVDQERISAAIASPLGMVLVVGPTGSGKTTTLYALLRKLNTGSEHIATIEDPVEYELPGVSQLSVDLKADLTFASGLRALVRQDPDIIMVGEIRDRETADISVNAAMTGHLVLSTLHANDAATTLPRLIELGVEPFLIASTVKLVVAQRLARRLCTRCRVSYAPTAEELELIARLPDAARALVGSGAIFFRGEGCDLCHRTGYRGRVGLFEVLPVTEPIRAMVVERSSNAAIERLERELGIESLLTAGLRQVILGETSLQEVVRVCGTGE